METKHIPSGRGPLKFSIEKIKQKVSVTDYLEAKGIEVRNNRARCIVHDGSNPTAFSISPDGQRWRCFSCGWFGDLIDLCELVEKHPDCFTAVASLSVQFGVETAKPARWFERHEERHRLRKGLVKINRDSWKRRFFNACYRDSLFTIPDPVERAEETDRVWELLDMLSQGVEL